MPASPRSTLQRFSIPLVTMSLLALAMTGCQSTPAEETAPEVEEVVFDPSIEVTERVTTLETTDKAGLPITLTLPVPAATVTGVDPAIAEQFTEAVRGGVTSGVDEQLQRYSDLTLIECGDEEASGSCEREASFKVEQYGVYEDYGSVASRTGFILGSRDRNMQVHSVTMNLRTGEVAKLSDFIDLTDDTDRSRATNALQSAENWHTCTGDPDVGTPEAYLEQAGAFSPSEDGLLLLWAPNPTSTALCQVEQVVVPWAGMEPPVEEEPAPAASWEDLNGSWCNSETGTCFTIKLADTSEVEYIFLQQEGDCFAGGAQSPGMAMPLLYCPAGAAVPEKYSFVGDADGAQDRWWHTNFEGAAPNYRQ